MTDVTAKIGKFDPDNRSVLVTFTNGEIVHTRNVNAVLKANGSYDKAATKDRVDDVARGVAHKIALGLIINPPPAEPDAPAA